VTGCNVEVGAWVRAVSWVLEFGMKGEEMRCHQILFIPPG
jgi:hypothetical protein